MEPSEFIQLSTEDLIDRFESGLGFSDVSHVVKRTRMRKLREFYLLKRCLVIDEERRNVVTKDGCETTDIYITYRDFGLWLTITKDQEKTKVRLVKRYEWENNGWEEKSSWPN